MDLLIRYTSIGDGDCKAHEYLKKLPGNLMIVEETGVEGAKHYHAWYRGIQTSKNVSQWLARNGWSGSYSVKTGDGNPKYMCKGPTAVSKLKRPEYPGTKTDPIVVYDSWGVDVRAEHDSWWTEAVAWKSRKTAAKAVKDEVEKLSLKKLMEEWYDKEEANLKLMRRDDRLRAMLRRAVQFNADALKWGQYDIQRVVEGLYARLPDGEDAMVSELEKRVHRNIV